MSDNNFKDILFGTILVSLFAVLIIGGAISQGKLYGKDTLQIETSLNYHSFNDSISSVKDTSENLRESFEKQSIWSAIAGIIVSGIFDIAKSMVLMILLPFSLISAILVNILGVPLIVANVMVGLLVMAIIFGIWKLLKLGE